MKKIMSLFAALMMFASMNAQQLAMANLTPMDEMVPANATKKFVAPKAKKAMKAHTVNANSGDEFLGKFVQDEYYYNDDCFYVGSSVEIEIVKDGDNYVIKNWHNGGFDVVCTFEDGQLVAEPMQTIFNHSTYGEIGLCAWDTDDDDTVILSPEEPIYFSLKDDGTIEMDNFGWAYALKAPEYEGYLFFPVFIWTTFYPVTATATDTDKNGNTKTYDVAVEAEDDVIYIHGFGLGLASVYAYPVDWEAREGYIGAGQDAAYSTQTGVFSTHAIEIRDGKYYLSEDEDIAITLTDNAFTTGSYAFYNMDSNSVYMGMKSTTITLKEGTWPAYENQETTGIVNVESENAARLYNIQGIEVKNATQSGLYIKNGKKFVVK